jgi:hypothetical protein
MKLLSGPRAGLALLLACLGLAGGPGLEAQTVPSGYRTSIPVGSLRDPQNMVHAFNGKLTRPIVAIFSIPNMSQGGTQERWASALADDPGTRLPDTVGLFLVEDMVTGFSDLARKEMKKQYVPGQRPVVLLDEDSAIREKFGVAKGKTCVLVYSRENKLAYVQEGKPTPKAIANVRAAALALVGK